MKKIVNCMLLLLSVLFVSACATTETDVVKTKLSFLNDIGKNKITLSDEEKIDRIIQFYKKRLDKFENLEIKFLEKISANEDLAFDAFIFSFKVNDGEQKELVFSKDNFIFSNFVSLENFETSEKIAFNIANKEKNKIILKELENDKDYIITLGSGDKEIYAFSDPLCPFCKEHLEKIDEDYLKSHKIHFIFTTIHGDDGFKRAQLIYENIKNGTDDMEKLRIIKYYFSENMSQEPIFKDENFLRMMYEKYLKLGVKFVPYIIEIQ